MQCYKSKYVMRSFIFSFVVSNRSTFYLFIYYCYYYLYANIYFL